MKKIAIVGGGPSGMFMFKRFVESGIRDEEINIFEKSSRLGAGMPYSQAGASCEHVTNVSENEIPDIVTPIHTWIETVSDEHLKRFNITRSNFNEYKVLPRLFFGDYLCGQFNLLLKEAKEKGIETHIHFDASVVDIIWKQESEKASVKTSDGEFSDFDICIICTGHNWPVKNEGKVAGYFDSPYPPSKLALKINDTVAIRGASLTAVDAIRTLARNNGYFEETGSGMLKFHRFEGSEKFKIALHSRHGFLPSIRFHLNDSHLSDHSALTKESIELNRAENDGFLTLDFVFDRAFKSAFAQKDPEFYEQIKDLNLEQFVDKMMLLRETLDPFVLFHAEYVEAEKSIRRKQSIFWKEMLAILSFSMNYPAKHFSAEDMERLHHSLSHLISLVIAFVPQSSAKEILALHAAGALDMIAVGNNSKIQAKEQGINWEFTDSDNVKHAIDYKMFVDCVGQPHLSIEDFPFKSLVNDKQVSQAYLKFRSVEQAKQKISEDAGGILKLGESDYYMKVSGIAINDHFQIVNSFGAANERIYIMAVPYISGYNPDYSGLDFCEAASAIIHNNISKLTVPQ